MRNSQTNRVRSIVGPPLAILLMALSLVLVTGGTSTAAGGDVYICHATGDTKAPKVQRLEDVKGFVVNSPSEGGDVSGHVGDGHQDGWDIIPPVPGLPEGQNWTAYGQAVYNTINNSGQGCNIPELDATAAQPTKTPATCTSGETLVLGAISNATWSGTPAGTAGPADYSVTATADTGHLFADKTTTRTFTGSLAGPLPSGTVACPNENASATAQVTPATCTSGAILTWSGQNVTFNRNDKPLTGPLSGVTITATPNSTSVWNDDPKNTATRTIFSGNLAGPLAATSEDCPDLDATAAEPTKTPATCTSGEKLVLGAVQYAVWSGTADGTEGPADYSVTATAVSGHRFGDGSRNLDFTGSLAGPLAATSEDCPDLDATAAEPTKTPATCTSGEKLVLGAVQYAVWSGTADGTEGPGAFSVTATTVAGHRFADGTREQTFTGNLADKLPATSEDCPDLDATAAEPTKTPATCTSGEELVLGAVQYAVWSGTADGTEGPADYSVTATAVSGHRFGDGSRTLDFAGSLSGPLSADDDRCAVEDATAELDTNPPTCDTGETLVLGEVVNADWGVPTRTEGGGDYAVTATADFGHRFDGGSRTLDFAGTLAGPLSADDDRCADEDAAAAYVVNDPTCSDGAMLELGETTFASWGTPTLTEGPGDYEAIATADFGHRFDDGSRTMTITGTLAGPIEADNDLCAIADATASVSTLPPSCDTGETLVLGETTFASWGTPTLTEGPGDYEVTATADQGHRFDTTDKTETFTGTLAGPLSADADECAETDAAAAVSVTPASCDTGETLAYGDIVNAVFSGTADGTEGPAAYVVVATADTGHRFGDGARTEVFAGQLAGPLSADDPACYVAPEEIELPAQPGVSDPCGAGNATWQVPADVPGVLDWELTDGDLVVTILAENTVFAGTDGETSHSFGQAPETNTEECEVGGVQLEVPAEPEVKDPCGADNATWVVPADTDELAWTLDATTGALSVEVLTPDTVFEGTQDTTFDFGVAEETNTKACEVKGEEEDEPKDDTPTVEVKGEQAVPTAVDAGLGGGDGSVPPVRRNPLWLMAIGGGLAMMGLAGTRRRKVADR